MEKLGSEGLLVDDYLQIRVDLTVFDQPRSSITSAYTRPLATALKAAQNFESLRGAADLSDIKILCGAETFNAHKAILAGQSDVFKRMLTSDMAEVKSGIITVTDMTSDVIKILLRYMYTGKVGHELDDDSLLDIIYGAEKYGLNDLKDYCFRKLLACINEENVGALAVAAHLYRADECVNMTLQKFIEP